MAISTKLIFRHRLSVNESINQLSLFI